MLKVKEGKSYLTTIFFFTDKGKEEKNAWLYRVNYVSQLLMRHAWEREKTQPVICDWETKLFWKVLLNLHRQGEKYFHWST